MADDAEPLTDAQEEAPPDVTQPPAPLPPWERYKAAAAPAAPAAPWEKYAALKPVKPVDEPEPGLGTVLYEAAKRGTERGIINPVRQAARVASGNEPETLPEPTDKIAEYTSAPYEFTVPHSLGEAAQGAKKIIGKVTQGLFESVPEMGGSIAAEAVLAPAVAAAAAASGPAAPLVGFLGAAGAAGIGAAGVHALKSFAPIYAEELQKTPADKEGAFSRALASTRQDSIFTGLTFGLFKFAPFQSAAKNLLFQGLAVQPTAAMGEQAIKNVEEGKPITEGLPQAAGEAAVGTVVPMLADAGARRVIGRRGAAAPPGEGGEKPAAETTPAGAELPPVPPSRAPGRAAAVEDYVNSQFKDLAAKPPGEEQPNADVPAVREGSPPEAAPDAGAVPPVLEGGEPRGEPAAEKPIGEAPADEQAPAAGDDAAAAVAAHVDEEDAKVHPEPSDAQVKAGNFPKGHLRIPGLGHDISIETPSGGERRGRDPENPWVAKMPDDTSYGQILRTEGADREPVDAYILGDPANGRASVIDQIDPATGAFDENKLLFGGRSQEEALDRYAASFSDGRGMERVGAITETSVPEVREWLKSGDTTRPFADQVPPRQPGPVDFSPLQARLQHVVGDQVALRIVDQLKAEGGVAADGSYDAKTPIGRVITLARDMAAGMERPTLDHEMVHALEEMGAFTPEEWQILAHEAAVSHSDVGASKRLGREVTTDARYEEMLRGQDGATDESVARGLVSERVARMLSDVLNGEHKLTGQAGGLVDKLRQMLQAIGNWSRGLGLRTAAGIAKDVEAGRYAQTAEPAPQPKAATAEIPKPIRKGASPLNLLQFIAANGGIRDDGGDLRAMNAQRFIPGRGMLVRKSGVPPDKMRQMAVDAGYLAPDDPNAPPTSSITDLHDAIEQSIAGNPVYSREDMAEVEARREEDARIVEARKLADEYGIDHSGIKDADLPEVIAHAEATRDAMLDAMDAAHDDAMAAHYAGDDDLKALELPHEAEIPFEDLAPGAPEVGAGDARPEAEARDEGGIRPGGVGREEGTGAARATEGIGQFVIPGTEVTEADRGAARGRQPLRGGNKPADEGLFDAGARGQTDLVDQAKQPPKFSLRDEEKAAPFFSELQRAVERGPAKAPAVNWKAYIKNAAAKGVKQAEVDWSGINDFLDGRQGGITKQEVLDHLKANEVQLREVTKGAGYRGSDAAYNAAADWVEAKHPGLETALNELDDGANVAGNMALLRAAGMPDDMVSALRRSGVEGETKYSQYQLPGGENYREMLLTLPVKQSEAQQKRLRDLQLRSIRLTAQLAELREDNESGKISHDQMHERLKNNREQYAADQAEMKELAEQKLGREYRSPHWDEPNVLAHIRMNDRTDAQGRKLLHVEEIQSDWHQEGRKRGYRGHQEAQLADLVARRDSLPEGHEREMAQREINDLGRSDPGVPDAPFKKTWHELALKRVLRHAAEHGYDAVSWTPGEEQAARYDLSRHIDFIDYSKHRGRYSLSARRKLPRGKYEEVLNKDGMTADDLERMVGKDAAKKIIDNVGRPIGYPEGAGVLKGLDLKVGGEGMKGFYDEMVPSFLNKYAKKWGAKVGESEIATAGGKPTDYADFDAWQRAQSETLKVPSIDITPAMRESVVKEGQPMFALRRTEQEIGDDEQARQARNSRITSALKAPLRALVNTAPMQRLVNGEMFRGLQKGWQEFDRSFRLLASPMTVGTDQARAITKKFAVDMRDLYFRFGQLDQKIVKLYDYNERKLMGEALDQESVEDQKAAADPDYERDPTKGLSRLTDDQRATVELLNNLSQQVWQRMYDAGIVKSEEGLPHYMPRMFVKMAEGNFERAFAEGEGASPLDPIGRNLSTSGPKRRNYLEAEESEAAAKAKGGDDTTLVTDIRALLLALQRGERAVAGKRLIDSIKAAGDSAGAEAVRDSDSKGFFTIDHPAFKEWKPDLEQGEVTPDDLAGRDLVVQDGAVWKPVPNGEPRLLRSYQVDRDGKVTQWRTKLDEKGNPIFVSKPLYVSREFEGPLRAVLTKPSSAWYRALLDLKQAGVQMVMISPMIHNMVEFGRAFPLMPGKMLTLRVYMDGYKAKQDTDLMRDAIQHGLVPIGSAGHLPDITEIANEPGMKPGRSILTRAAGNIVGMVGGEEANMATRRAIDKVGQVMHGTLLWDRIADLQAGLYTNLRDEYLNKGYSDTAAKTLAAHQANRYAGALPPEAMSDVARKVANIAMFSRTFTLGNLGAMKDMLNGLPMDVRAKLGTEIGQLQAQAAASAAKGKAIHAFMTDLALFYGMNAAIQAGIQVLGGQGMAGMGAGALAGLAAGTAAAGVPGAIVGGIAGGAAGAALGYDKDKPHVSPQDIADGFWRRAQTLGHRVAEHPLDVLNPFDMVQSMMPGGENEPGKENRILMGRDDTGRAWYARNSFGKIGEEFAGWLSSPIQMMRNKTSTLLHPMIDVYQNADSFGRKIYDTEDKTAMGMARSVGKIVSHMMEAQLPLSTVQGVHDMVTGARSGGLDIAQTVLPLAGGITLSRGYPGGPQEGVIARANRERTEKLTEVRSDARKLVAAGKSAEAFQTMLKGGMTPEAARTALRTMLTPAANLARQEKAFGKTATPEQLQQLRDVNQ